MELNFKGKPTSYYLRIMAEDVYIGRILVICCYISDRAENVIQTQKLQGSLVYRGNGLCNGFHLV